VRGAPCLMRGDRSTATQPDRAFQGSTTPSSSLPAIDQDGALLDFDYREVSGAQAIISNARSVLLVARTPRIQAQRAVTGADITPDQHLRDRCRAARPGLRSRRNPVIAVIEAVCRVVEAYEGRRRAPLSSCRLISEILRKTGPAELLSHFTL